MSKKQALTEFHRGSILAAAERLFAEKGTEKTTMDDIAREAEYSKATLYVYFQSKEEIINAILLSGMVLLKKKIHEAIESHSDWYQAYDAVCRSIVRFYDENPTAYDAATGTMPLVQEADETQKGVADILRVSSEIDEELAAFLVRGAAEGAVRSQLPPMDGSAVLVRPVRHGAYRRYPGGIYSEDHRSVPGGVSPARHPPATGLYHQGQRIIKKAPRLRPGRFFGFIRR